MNSSEYINSQRKAYSLYVLSSRAIPHAADGLKAAARRVLWIGRDGKKHKSASLAGATMPIHPHATPESTINTLAAPYGNNIPLLSSEGAFGTMLRPTAYGASRYTSVKVSQFTKDVMFKDIEIVPLEDCYDNSQPEPTHFLPLVPMALINPQEGIAVGFACSILPRDIRKIIEHQIKYLEKGTAPKYECLPTFYPTEQTAVDFAEDRNGNIKWVFRGAIDKTNTTLLTVTSLPYGLSHQKFINKLDVLQESGAVINYEDNSRNTYNITIKLKRGTLREKSDNEILQFLGLQTAISENLNVVDFDGERVWTVEYADMVAKFTDWRLSWYVKRYERLANLLAIDIQRLQDIITAIEKNVGGMAKKIASRGELKEFLTAIGVVHLDYIADLPVYRFTDEERIKTESKLEDALSKMEEYQRLLKSEDLRKEVYANELREVKRNVPTYIAGG